MAFVRNQDGQSGTSAVVRRQDRRVLDTSSLQFAADTVQGEAAGNGSLPDAAQGRGEGRTLTESEGTE